MQMSPNDALSQCSASACLLLYFKWFSRKMLFCIKPTNLELLTSSCKIASPSLPSTHGWFWVDSKRQNRLLTLPENLGDRFCCRGCRRGEQKPQIACPVFSGQKHLFWEQCGWVLRRSSVFVLKRLVRRHLTSKFYFHMYWLESPDLPPPLNPPCQLSFLTK